MTNIDKWRKDKNKMEECLFCRVLKNKEIKFIYENEDFCSFEDPNPATKGHPLIIPKKHIVSFFDLSQKELIRLFEIIKKTKEFIDKAYKPDGYNIGINEGKTAGRTINHLHIHLIPRYKGDVQNPIGGVRNIIPGKGDYTKKT